MPIVKKLDKGKYLVRVYKGTGALRYCHNKTLKCTLAEANKYANEIQSQIDRGRSPYSLETLLKYSKIWLKRKPIKQTTKDFYESVIRLYAAPLHQTPLFKITSDHIQRIYDNLNVSPNTVRHLHSTLRAMFKHAVKQRHLFENPVDFTTPPKKIKAIVDYWDEQEALRVMAACENSLRGLLFEFALETGCRPGEYIGLRKKDIVYGQVSITQSLSRKGVYGDPKTVKSKRLIPLSAPLLAKLEAHMASHEHDLIFCTELGTPYLQGNLQRDLDRIVKATGVRHISLYGLRHTMATLMLLGQENPKVVSERLGHASVTITLDTYSHVLPHIQEGATNRLSGMLRGDAHFTRTQPQIESDLVN